MQKSVAHWYLFNSIMKKVNNINIILKYLLWRQLAKNLIKKNSI